MLVGRFRTDKEKKNSGLKERFRICKIEIHPRERYSYPGEGAIVARSIANYIIMQETGEEEWKRIVELTS